MRTSENDERPKVAVLILNYNGIRYLGESLFRKCMDSVLATTYSSFDVAVIDNASSDGSPEFIKNNYPKIRLIENEENYGFARAYNKVIESIDSPYLALLNNDLVVEPEWLDTLLSHMVNDDGIAATGPKMLFLQDRGRINAAGGLCDIFGIGMNRGNGETDNGHYDRVEETFYVNGAALITKKAVWQDIGGFDERYFMYVDDLDWCWRARLRGYRVVYNPITTAYHCWQASGGSMTYFLEKYWLTTVLKNYSFKTLLLIFPRYVALRTLKMLWLLKNGGHLAEKTAVLASLFWNLRNLRQTWKKHLQVQALRRLSDKEVQRHMYGRSLEIQLWRGKIEHPAVEDLLKRKSQAV